MTVTQWLRWLRPPAGRSRWHRRRRRRRSRRIEGAAGLPGPWCHGSICMYLSVSLPYLYVYRMYVSVFACMCMYPQWFGKKIVKNEMSYCMYVACMLYVCIMMIQVGRARPWARASAVVPGRDRRGRYSDSDLCDSDCCSSWALNIIFLMLFKLRMQLDFVFKIFWSFDWNSSWNVPVCCTEPLTAWK